MRSFASPPWTHAIYGLDFDRAAAAQKDAIVVGSGNGPPVLAEPWLRRAMVIDPPLKVYVAIGRYDSPNSCEHSAFIITHMEPQFGRNMKSGCYAGGHMMYADHDARLQLKRDVAGRKRRIRCRRFRARRFNPRFRTVFRWLLLAI